MSEIYTAPDLLKKPIPLEARLTFAGPDKDHTTWRQAATIAARLGTYDARVTRYAAHLELPYDERLEPINGRIARFYPPYAETLLKDEFEWKETYDQLPARVGVTAIAENIGRSQGWTAKTLEEIGIQSAGDELYPRSAIQKLRHISMSVPLDDGWYNLRQLELFTEADREWIQRRLAEQGNEPQRRRSSLTGKIHSYYAPSSVPLIMEALQQRPGAAGDWLTVHAIAKQIGRTEKWVVARLKPHQDLGLLKQDDEGVPRKHWPPVITEMLAEESDRLKSLPDGEDFLNGDALARRLGHATHRAMQLCNEMDIEAEEYRDGKGRSNFGFRKSLVPQVKAFAESRAEKDIVTDEALLESLFVVGSVRSRVNALHKRIVALKDQGVDDEERQVKESLDAITELNAELRIVRQRHYRLIKRADRLPGFISGDNKSKLPESGV